MIGRKEEQEISNYLKEYKINREEVYEELFDHLATSYEKALIENSETDIKSHIRNEVQSSFGGAIAMKRLICQRRNIAHSAYWNMLLSNFKSYFKGPRLVVTTGILVLLYISLSNFDQARTYNLALAFISAVMILPLAAAMYGYVSFRVSCKRLGKAYRSSIKNHMIIYQSILPTSLFHFFNVFNIIFDLDKVLLPNWSIILIATFITLYLLLCLGYLKLVRNEFDFKPAIK